MESAIQWGKFDADRRRHILDELRHALKGVRDHELKLWALQIPATAGKVTVRRGRNFKQSAQAVGRVARKEWAGVREAWHAGETVGFIKNKTQEMAVGTRDHSQAAYAVVADLHRRVAANPRSEAPVLVAGVVGFLAGSGGLDGDGGIPDLDLLGGIGAHRSLLTHTIVAGILAETLIRTTVDLAVRIHSNLPEDHDELWDTLRQGDPRMIEALCGGVSMGLAYHFAVDSTVDAGGAYSALKGVVSPAVDNVIQAANAAVEANDAIRRAKDKGEGNARPK